MPGRLCANLAIVPMSKGIKAIINMQLVNQANITKIFVIKHPMFSTIFDIVNLLRNKKISSFW